MLCAFVALWTRPNRGRKNVVDHPTYLAVCNRDVGGWPSRSLRNRTDAFVERLRSPEKAQDYEDPLIGTIVSDEINDRMEEPEMQLTGIILQDNDDESKEERPPLPPRPAVTNSEPLTTGPAETARVPRKPVASLQLPPRYSTIIGASDDSIQDSPIDSAATADGFAPQRLEGNFARQIGSDSEGMCLFRCSSLDE